MIDSSELKFGESLPIQISDEEVHGLLNSLGIIKNKAELMLLNKNKHATKEGRVQDLQSIIIRTDKIINLIKAKRTQQ